jgi:hypothetical protein
MLLWAPLSRSFCCCVAHQPGYSIVLPRYDYRFRRRGNIMNIRRLTLLTLAAGIVSACTGPYGSSGPQDVGLKAEFDKLRLPVTMDAAGPIDSDSSLQIRRNQILNEWIVKSDFLCSDYQLNLSREIRDTRLGTDIAATVLSGMATVFAKPALIHPLSGAATVALGVGGDIQSDLFLQQAGDVVSTAIQAVRTRARTEMQKKFAASYKDYTLEQGLVDVQRYDRETCNLNVGLNEIRASLNIVGNIAGPLSPQASNPIIPLPAAPAETGGSPAGGGPAPASTGPVATTIIPPDIQKTPQGGFVFTPGKLVSTPASVPPVTAPAPLQPQAPRSPRPGPPIPLHSEPACQDTGPIIPPACPPLAPELQARRKQVSDTVKKLVDLAKLAAVARALSVPTPVSTVKCIRKDIVAQVEQICTDDKLQEMNRALAGVSSNR